MERKQVQLWLQTLCAACLGALICLGGIGCVLTAYDLPGNWLNAWKFCAGSALLVALCCHWRYSGWLLLPLGAGFAWYLTRHTGWLVQLESLLHAVSIRLDSGYGWGIIAWSGKTLSGRPVLRAAEYISLLPCVLAVWSVRRRRRIWLAAIVGALPLAACLILTDTLPELLPLTMVLLGLGLLLLTQSARRQDGWEGCKLTLALVVPVLALLGAVLVLMPRENYKQSPKAREAVMQLMTRLPFVSESEQGALQVDFSGGGLEESLDLSAIGPKRELRYQVMEVTADIGGDLYLRGQTLGRYTGTGWEAVETDFDEQFAPEERYVALSLPQFGQNPQGNVTVSTLQAKDLLYTTYYPTDHAMAALLAGDAYVENPDKLTEYTFSRADRTKGTELYLWGTEAALQERYYAFAVAHYLELPAETAAWAEELLRSQVFTGEKAHYTYRMENLHFQNENDLHVAAEAEVMTLAGEIGRWVSNYGKYDLNTPRMDREQEDFVRWFLEDSETGYCVHYASAAVVLLRAAGIPARYASGYLALDVPDGVPTAVTSDRSHAWAEYFLPGVGWVLLDATPEQGRPQPTPETEPTTRPTETREPRPTTEPTEPRPTEPQGSAKTQSAALKRLKQAGLWVLKAALVLGIIWLQSRLRLRLRERWLSCADVKKRILRLWRYARFLAKIDGKVLPEALHGLALEARFSNHTLTEAHAAPLTEELEARCRGFRQSGLLRRLGYRVVLALW